MRPCLIAAVIVLACLPSSARAQLQGPVQDIGVRPDLLKDVGIDQKLDQSIPLDLAFRDEHGHPVQLGQYFGEKPVILSLVYYNCPMLCTQVLNGLESSLKLIPMDIGKQFNVVTVSVDPTERPVLAEAKQALYSGLYGRPGAADGWHFLTGDEQQIKRLANAVGFRYAYDPGFETVRPCQRHHGPDAEGENFALLLRNSIPIARPSAWFGGGFGGENWHSGRSSAALLLSLRCVDREIWAADIAPDSSGRSCNRVGHRWASLGALPKRKLRVAGTKSVTTLSSAGNCVSKRN